MEETIFQFVTANFSFFVEIPGKPRRVESIQEAVAYKIESLQNRRSIDHHKNPYRPYNY